MPEMNDKEGGTPTDAEAREALARVVASDTFASSPRLQRFLTYVANETLAGRGGAIRGKTVAADVYDRAIDDIDSGENLVRVEARRLRRLLGEYYAGPGESDPWRIHIDLGGYVPRFDPAGPATRPPLESQSGEAPSLPGKRLVQAGSLSLLVLAAIAVFGLWRSDGPETSAERDDPVRAALRARSVRALQAVNLAEQARGMFFPVFDIKRQELALEMYKHAIDLDPGLHQGYAGAAQVLATLTVFARDRDIASAYRNDANRMADKAVEIAPDSAWAHAAKAWVLAVSGVTGDALDQARLAVKLAPQDGHVLDLAGITAILSNDPELAADVSDPIRTRSGVGRFGANNIWGVSQYMLGDYDTVIETFTSAPAAGSPVSAPSLNFLAVAYDHAGEDDKAERLVRELSETWPDFPVTFIIDRVFQNGPAYRLDILERLSKHGYRRD